MTLRSSDEDLVARHLHGDPDALGELIDRYSGRLFNLAYRFLGDRAEAEDIAQETFVRALAALPRSRLELPFRPWLFQIGVNLCRDWARRKRPIPFTDLSASEDGAEALPDPGPLVADEMEARATAAAVRAAVMKLPAAQRLIVTLRYTEELSYDEIGRLLNMPTATVGTSLLRARRRLRAALLEAGEANDERAS